MTASSPFKRFISARATLTLLCILAGMLLLNVVLPQADSLGEEEFSRLVSQSPVSRLLLEELGLGRMTTSPVFLTVLGLFFLNLLAVLASRIQPTLRRVSLRPLSEKGLEAWARIEETLVTPLPENFDVGDVARVLRGFGYEVRRAGDRVFWSVRHRTAPLGFLVFHLSFLFFCAGGVLIYYTRFVGTVVLVEGQTFEGGFSDVLRQPLLSPPPDFAFTVARVDPEYQEGQALHLGADLLFHRAGGDSLRTTRVNYPASWGSSRVLVERAGLAPVLWLQDADGFTLDQVAVPARTLGGGKPTEIPLNEGRTRVFVRPLEPEAAFPSRSELAATELRLQILQDETLVFSDDLRPGQAADLGDGRLVLRELRYWVAVRIIAERGGGLLVAGFVLAVIGLIWRLLWYRRELVVNWDATSLRLVGRSEYFSWRFERELREVFEALQRGFDEPESRSDAVATPEGSEE